MWYSTRRVHDEKKYNMHFNTSSVDDEHVFIPLNVRDLPSFVSFFGYLIFSGVKKSTIHSFAGSSDLQNTKNIELFLKYMYLRFFFNMNTISSINCIENKKLLFNYFKLKILI